MKWNPGLSWFTLPRLKLIAALVGLGVAALLAMITVIYSKFDAEQVRMQLSDALQTDGRQLTLSGPITPAIFPRPGIKIEQLSLSETDGNTPFLVLRRAEVRLAWLPLFQGNKVIHAIKLDGVQLNLQRDRKGDWNFADLLARKTRLPMAVKLDWLKLADLNIQLDDQVFKRQLSLNQGALEASGMLGNAQLSVAGLLKSGEHQASVVLESPLNVADEQFTLDNFKLTANGLLAGLSDSRAELTGTVRINPVSRQLTAETLHAALSSREPSVAITARMPSADLSLGKDGFHAPTLEFNAALNNQGSNYSFSGQLSDIAGRWQTLTARQLTGAMSWKAPGEHTLTAHLQAPVTLNDWETIRLSPLKADTTLATPLLPRGQLKATAKGELIANLGSQHVSTRLNGTIDGQRFDFTGEQDGFITPLHNVRLSLGKLDLNRYLAESTGNRVGLFYGNRKFDLDWLKALNLTGDIRIAELTAGRFTMQQVGSKLAFTPNKLLLEDITALIYGGNLNGRLELTPGEQPRLVVHETLAGMNIRPLLRDLLDFDQLDGKGRLEATLTAEGQTFTQLRKTLSGTVRVGLTEGALLGVDLVDAIKRLPAELGRLGENTGKRTEFQSLTAQFNLNHGVARNQDLRLNSNLLSLQGHGKVDLVSSIIDYAMRVQPNILVFTNTKEMNVPLKITGELSAPTYALDFNALVKDKKTDLEKQQVLKEQLTNQFNLFKNP